MAKKKQTGSSAPPDEHVFLVSADLVHHERFLHAFAPIGDADQDLRAFFAGVGQAELAEQTVESGGNLVELALGIISNHRNEMDRIDRDEPTRWGSASDGSQSRSGCTGT